MGGQQARDPPFVHLIGFQSFMYLREQDDTPHGDDLFSVLLCFEAGSNGLGEKTLDWRVRQSMA